MEYNPELSRCELDCLEGQFYDDYFERCMVSRDCYGVSCDSSPITMLPDQRCEDIKSYGYNYTTQPPFVCSLSKNDYQTCYYPYIPSLANACELIELSVLVPRVYQSQNGVQVEKTCEQIPISSYQIDGQSYSYLSLSFSEPSCEETEAGLVCYDPVSSNPCLITRLTPARIYGSCEVIVVIGQTDQGRRYTSELPEACSIRSDIQIFNQLDQTSQDIATNLNKIANYLEER